MGDANVPRTVEELYFWLSGRFSAMEKFEDRVDKDLNGIRCSTKKDVIQVEERVNQDIGEVKASITEHKESHWKFAAAVISASGVFVALLSLVLKMFFKGS